MMRVFYDCEFLEDGRSIDLISIGMVREDGAEYYAVSQDATKGRLNRRIRKHDWLMANVVPHLPKAHGDWNLHMPERWLFNYSDPCVRPRHVIAREVRGFVLAVPGPELWGWYVSYDHVVIAQLFGRMIDLPPGFPMYSRDLKQEADRLGNPALPSLPGAREHNALSDAREVKFRYEWLMNRAKQPETGLDKVAKAVRKARGGDPPAQIRGYA